MTSILPYKSLSSEESLQKIIKREEVLSIEKVNKLKVIENKLDAKISSINYFLHVPKIECLNGTENDIVTFELLSGATVLVKISTLDLVRDVLTNYLANKALMIYFY